MIIAFAILLLLISAVAAVFASIRFRKDPVGWALVVAVVSAVVGLMSLLRLFGWMMLVVSALAAIMAYSYVEWSKTKDALTRNLLVACALLLLVLGAVRILRTPRPGTDRVAIARVKQEVKAAEVCWRVLGEYLSRRYPGQRVLLLEPASMAVNEAYRTQVLGELVEGGSGKLLVGAHEPVMRPLSWAYYNELLARHADCRVILSLPGMPGGEAPLRRRSDIFPKLVIVSEAGLTGNLTPVLVSGLIAAAVLDCRDVKGVVQASKGYTVPVLYSPAFHARYVLLDADSVPPVREASATPPPSSK